MGTPGTDSSSWAGWAISSFTNKLAAADGLIQPDAVIAAVGGVPPPSQTTAMPHRTMLKPPAPPFSRSATETTKLAQSFSAPEAAEQAGFWDDNDEDAVDDAWGAMADDVDDDIDNDNDNANPAPTPKPTTTKQQPAAAKPHWKDDADEPDFAGWLKAQTTAKKTPLSKGLPGPASTTPSALPKSGITATRKPTVVVAAKTVGAATVTATTSAAVLSAVKKGVPRTAPATAAAAGKKNKVAAEADDEADEGWGDDAWD